MENLKDSQETNPTSSSFDGSTLPQMLSGLDGYKPENVPERTIFYAKDTKNKYIFISKNWVFIEKLV